MPTYTTPKKNCLKCDNYNECSKFEDGRCLLYSDNKRVSPKKYTLNGLTMTAKEWSDYLDISYFAIQKQLVRNGIKGLEKVISKYKRSNL